MRILGRQIFFFLVCGVMAFVADAFVYHRLLDFIPIPLAKGCSFLVGTLISFTLNKIITFQQRWFCHRQVVRFSILYISTLLINVAVNQAGIYMMGGSLLTPFIIAALVSAALNFTGQKMWVFRNQIAEKG